jgi:small nuclear ribonucleoprotein (snRNP)-like protein
LTNVFGNEAAATLLLFKIEREYWSVLKTFLQYLNVVSEDELPTVKINKTLLSSLEKL